MAELAPETGWTTAQTRAQFAAIARLRWRITVNSFRRKGGGGEVAARIITYPIFAAMAFGPTIGVGIAAFFFTQSGNLGHISWLLWGTFVVCQLLNIQLGQPGTTFDPTQLIRFPLSVAQYTAIRLFFGVLTPANIIGTMMSFAIALGVLIVQPGLWLYALAALGAFAAANVLFSRMVFAWVDRWLATRRAREIFTSLIFVFSLGIQYANFTYNPAYHHHDHRAPAHRLSSIGGLYRRARPYLQALPPELTASALVEAGQGHRATYLEETLGDAAFAALFLGVFALRMRTEFRGESLSDGANAVAKRKKRARTASGREEPARQETLPAVAPAALRRLSFNTTVSAMWGKELLYVRRSQGTLAAVIMPLAIAALFCMRISTRSGSTWTFPAVVAYVLLGMVAFSYNSLGLDGTGSQLYFLAPVRIRDVILGKNLVGFALAVAEVVLILAIVLCTGNVPTVMAVVASVLWAAGTLLFSTAMGNQRSLASPKKMNLSAMGRKQTSPLSGLISLGIMLLATGFGAGVMVPAVLFHVQWVMLPVFAAYAAGGLWVYNRILNSIDRFAYQHRESLFLELCKPD
jgi:ABC-2 type transport system permease protein